MIRLTTALVTLGVGMAVAMTASAQPGWWVGCNPEADLCRLLCGSDEGGALRRMSRSCRSYCGKE